MSGNVLLNVIQESNPDDLTRNLIRLQHSLKLVDAVSQEHQVSYLRKNSEATLELAISSMVSMVSQQFNVKDTLTDDQLLDCTLTIIDEFWMLRPEEILYCFKRAKVGAYGPVYNKLDTLTVLTWLRTYYDEERVTHFERKNNDLAPQGEEVDVMAAYRKEIESQKLNGAPTLVIQDHKKKEERRRDVSDQEKFEQFREEYFKKKKRDVRDIMGTDED